MKDLKAQFVSALLFVLTVAAVSCAIINFRQHRTYRLPDDGVTWVDRAPDSGDSKQNKVVALHVLPGSVAGNAHALKLEVACAALTAVIGAEADEAPAAPALV